MWRDDASLLDIVNAARLILDFTDGMEYGAFMADALTQSAVLYQIAVIGEATKRLSPEFRAQHPEIPWRAIAGMRDRLIHGYDQVRRERVWTVVTDEVPRLVAFIEPLVPPPEDALPDGKGAPDDRG